MISTQRGARAQLRANAFVSASASLANAPNDSQIDFNKRAQTNSLGAGTGNLVNENYYERNPTEVVEVRDVTSNQRHLM